MTAADNTAFSSQGKTIATQQLEYPEWHLGRTRYGVWALEVDAEDILERFHHAQQALANYLLPQYQRQPHITLYVCGFLDWLAPHHPQANDNVSQQRLEQQREKMREQLQVITRAGAGFTLTVGAIDSFSSAPYLQVRDPQQHLEKLRTACNIGEPAGSEFRSSPFTPHLTLGLYRDTFDCRALAQEFERVNHQQGFNEELPLTLRALHFMSYGSHCVGSTLRIESSLRF